MNIVKGSFGRDSRKDDGPRVNHNIKSREVRLISSDGQQLGIFILSEALKRAEEEGYDLVEVAPNADPPVCRIIDYGKYKYQKQKRDHEARKKQTFIQLKEVKVRPKIKDHDLETKVRHIRRFLESGNKAKVTVIFRWREMSNTDQGRVVLDRVRGMTTDVGHVESEPKLETRSMIMILAPAHKKEKAKEKKSAEKEAPEQTV